MKRAALIACLAVAASTPALAQSAPAAGGNVEFILGFDIGSGFDAYGRLISRHLSKHIPGHPNVVIKQMPGAGSAVAGRYIAEVAPKDGSVMGALMPGAMIQRFMKEGGAPLDATKLAFLGGAERGTRVCASSVKSKLATYEDALKETTFKIGGSAPGGSTYDYAAWHRNAAGAKFDLVSGYKGTQDLYLALQRGEIDGVCGVDWTAMKTQQAGLLQEKAIRIIAQDGMEPEPELTAMGVPQTWKFIKDPQDKKAVELIVAFQQAVGKSYVVPAGVPPAALKTLRTAFAETLKDPALLAEAGRMGLPIIYTPGEEVQKTVQDIYSASPDMLERMKRLQTAFK